MHKIMMIREFHSDSHTSLFHMNTSTEKQEQLLISQAVKNSNF